MTSVKCAVAVMVALVACAGLATWVSERALVGLQPGDDLPFPWALALALSNWYVRLEPWLALFGVGLAALLGAGLSRGTTVAEERRVLLAWLLIGGASAASEAVLYALVGVGSNLHLSVHVLTLGLGFGIVAIVASVVVAIHLQSRLQQLGSRLRGWHVAVAAVALSLLGPAVLLPPIVVWIYSGRARFDQQGVAA